MTTDDHATHALHHRIRALYATDEIPDRSHVEALAMEAYILERHLLDARARIAELEDDGTVAEARAVVQAPKSEPAPSSRGRRVYAHG